MKKPKPKVVDAATKEAARLLGSAGGRAGRGAAKRRPTSHYQIAGRKAADWRRRPGAFYVDGDRTYFCGEDRTLWQISSGPLGVFGRRVETLPRTATILRAGDVPPRAARLARRLAKS